MCHLATGSILHLSPSAVLLKQLPISCQLHSFLSYCVCLAGYSFCHQSPGVFRSIRRFITIDIQFWKQYSLALDPSNSPPSLSLWDGSKNILHQPATASRLETTSGAPRPDFLFCHFLPFLTSLQPTTHLLSTTCFQPVKIQYVRHQDKSGVPSLLPWSNRRSWASWIFYFAFVLSHLQIRSGSLTNCIRAFKAMHLEKNFPSYAMSLTDIDSNDFAPNGDYKVSQLHLRYSPRPSNTLPVFSLSPTATSSLKQPSPC